MAILKNNPLSDIITHNLRISNPIMSAATFNTILVVTTPPTVSKPKLTMNGVTPVSSADELLDYGFTAESEAYKAATAVFSQEAPPHTVLIKAVAAVEGLNIKTVLSESKDQIDFYAVYLTPTLSAVQKNILDTVEWVEAAEKIFAFEYQKVDSFPLSNTSYDRTFAVFSGLADGYTEKAQPDTNKYAALCMLTVGLSYTPGSANWAFKTLKTIVPSRLSAVQKHTLEEQGVTCLLRYGGQNLTIGGRMLSGEWIDVIHGSDWIKNEIDVNVVNVLRKNAKVGFQDEDFSMFYGAIEKALKRGQDNRFVALNNFDDDGNKIPGYEINIPLASSFTEAERKARKLFGITYKARLLGAVNHVAIEGYLEF